MNLDKVKVEINREKVGDAVGKLTSKSIKALFFAKALDEKRRLFEGDEFNKVDVTMIEGNLVMTFRRNGSPGYLKKTFDPRFVRLITDDWMNSPLLNRSGIASLIWNDDIPNKLRRRLEQKVERGTLREAELDKIVEIVKNFAKDVERAVEMNKSLL